MATTERNVVVGVFDSRRMAQEAVTELKRRGFTDDQIGVAGRDDSTGGTKTGQQGEGSYAEEGAVTGVVAGAGIGGLWALGIAAGALPAIGPVIAGGILASILASAAVGAAVGGLAGALIGLGIPEEEAKYYEEEFRAGRTIVTVKSGARTEEARGVLHSYGAHDIDSRPTVAAGSRSAGLRGKGEDVTMEVREEELHPYKESVEAGEVRVRKEVETEHRTIDVPVSREEVVVERHPAAGRTPSDAPIREGEEIRVPVKEEEVHLEKQPVVKEEVTVGKRKVADTEKVSGTVRKENVDIEKTGDVNVRKD
jgi:uncharacterized protein (TIGR02271 family)